MVLGAATVARRNSSLYLGSKHWSVNDCSHSFGIAYTCTDLRSEAVHRRDDCVELCSEDLSGFCLHIGKDRAGEKSSENLALRMILLNLCTAEIKTTRI